ncbi:hypothetical protein [Negadavirga shengliensis]|uniref:Uncharacterized protein n=1 Tax=Negadavirga shengliensis TaxID=1389218 RepID=A0ABV9T1A5_9BACT
MRKPNLLLLRNMWVVLLSAVLLFGCSQIDTFDAPDRSGGQERIPVMFKASNLNERQLFDVCGNAFNTPLLAGKDIPVGEVSAYNDSDNLYITVSIEGDYLQDWFIRKLHMYIGQVSVDFSQKVGKKNEIVNPAPGKFPFSTEVPADNPTGIQEFTWTLPLGEDMIDFGEFDIAVHADVVKVDNVEYDEHDDAVSAEVVQSEGAWAAGEAFSQKGNWAMYFSFAVTECGEDCNPEWRREVTVSQNGRFSPEEEDDLEVTYQINGANGGRVGEALVRRTGSAGNPNFTVEFTPDSEYDFEALEVCVYDLDGNGEVCSTEATFSEGVYVIGINNAPRTATAINAGGNVTASSSIVKLYVKSDACN